jgi:DNA polymerase III subunit epsilon
MQYAIVDIETTGGKPGQNKITEIAVNITDGKRVIERFSTLINPMMEIPPFITSLTGITNEMVAGSPVFEEISDELYDILKDKIFVAHNVGFDYNFLKAEFIQSNIQFNAQRVCTVKFTRRLVKGLRSYGLSNLCQHFNIKNKGRHRAFGDTDATTKLFHMLLEMDTGNELGKMLNIRSRVMNLPPNLSRETFNTLPEKPGVYYFLNDKAEVLYVGKAKNIKKRIESHLTGSLRQKNMKLLHEKIHDIDLELTGNELIALLLESHEIKRLNPPFNSTQKKSSRNFGIYRFKDIKGFERLTIEPAKPGHYSMATFSTLPEARAYLLKLTRKFDLCEKLNGLSAGNPGCNAFQYHLCKGACTGLEDMGSYNLRFEKLIAYLNTEKNNLLIIGAGRDMDEKSLVCFENGKYLGYGYVSRDEQITHVDSIKEHIQYYPDNKDIQRIIRFYINKKKIPEEVIRY